jgi:hypothetical protein
MKVISALKSQVSSLKFQPSAFSFHPSPGYFTLSSSERRFSIGFQRRREELLRIFDQLVADACQQGDSLQTAF